MINITIILAAGQNTRLKDLCFDSPKGMLSINGQGLVERLCLQFLPYSHDIIVVAGSNIASYKFLETKIPKVKVVGEKDKQHISNSESLYVGLNKINKKTDTITIIEGDVVLSNLAIARYFNSKRNNKFIVTNSPLNDNDDKTIYDTKKHLYYIDKDIVSHTICSSIKIIGKYLGVTTFSNSITNSLKKQLKANIKDAYIKSIEKYLDDSFEVIVIDKEHGLEIDTSFDYFEVLNNYNISRITDKKRLSELGFNKKLLRYIGVYDVFGGLIVQRLGFDGLWLGSYQISLANGVKDDETFNPLFSLDLAKKLKKHLVELPVIVDLGSGFQLDNDLEIFAKGIKQTNIVAVCIDDNKDSRTNSMFGGCNRQILKEDIFLNRVRHLRKVLPSNIKIIARTETLTVYKSSIDINKLTNRIHLLQHNSVDAILPHYIGEDYLYIKKMINKIESKKPLILIPTGLMNISQKLFSEIGIQLIVYANIDIRARFKCIKDMYLSLASFGKLENSHLELLANPLEINRFIETND